MELTEILEEISVGFKNSDEKSKRLQEYVNMVREALQEHGAIFENESVNIEKFELSGENIGNTFIQGSYGTHTAIKHPQYDVDADIGLILTNMNFRNSLREKIYARLVQKFPQYTVEMKKPCITIDFNDGYKIDIAIYSSYKGETLFHNSIGGIETVTKAKPKELVSFFNEKYCDENIKRGIVRLVKHFVKIASENLEVDEKNKIPSIAINLLIVDKAIKKYDSVEDTLFFNMEAIISDFIEYVEVNRENGPSLQELCVGNTFYKVTDITEVIKVLKKVQINLKNRQYSELIGDETFSRIYQKSNMKINASPIGTLGV